MLPIMDDLTVKDIGDVELTVFSAPGIVVIETIELGLSVCAYLTIERAEQHAQHVLMMIEQAKRLAGRGK
jgi:hypothetical protein